MLEKRHAKILEMVIVARRYGSHIFEIRSYQTRYSDLQIASTRVDVPEWAESMPRKEGVMAVTVSHRECFFFFSCKI